MNNKSVLKIITSVFILLFVVSVFGTVVSKSYAYDNPYVIESATIVNEIGDVEGSIQGINKDEILNDFKLHSINDSVTLKVLFKNVDDKEYIIKNITEDNSSDNIEYMLSYVENKRVEPNGTFEVLLIITYKNELTDLDLRNQDTPIKLAVSCSDDIDDLENENLVAESVIRVSNNRRTIDEVDNSELTVLDAEVKSEEVVNQELSRNPRTMDTIHSFLLLLLISALGSAVCLILLTRDNKKQLVVVVCIIFVVSTFIPIIVEAEDTTFNALIFKQPGIYDKYIVTYKDGDKEETKVVSYNSTDYLEEPTKEGYTFECWMNDGKVYDISEPLSDDVELVALFKANEYSIIFDKNNMLATGTMKNQSIYYDVPTELSNNEYKLNGYKFNGWNTSPDGSGVSYKNKEAVENLLTEGSITLYAQWKKTTTSSLITGKNLNVKMKTLAGNSNPTYNTDDVYIKEIKRVNNLPIEYANNQYLISVTTSDKPTYMWFKDGVINYFSEADEIYLNKDSSYMFNRLLTVRNIDTSFNTEYVTNMEQMFYKNEKLESLDLSNFNTSNVTSMRSMFSEVYSIKELDLSSFDTSKVKNFNFIFNQCYELTELDLSNFNTSSATTMSHLFSSAEKIKKIDISNFDLTNVTTIDASFSNMFALEEVVLNNLVTNKVTNMAKLFMNAKSIKKIDLSNFNTSNVTNMSQMFDGCESLEELNITSFDTSKVTNMKRMFAKLYNMKELDISHFNTMKVTSMVEMFMDDSSLTKLNLGNMDTTSLTDMGDMFRTCKLLTSIDISSFDTTKVTNMKGVFNGMNNLESIDVSNFVTSNVTNMQGMFSGLNKVKTIDVSNFDTSKVTNMAWMFDKMNELTTIYVSDKFVTTKVTKGNQMFEFDTNLKGQNNTTYNSKKITHQYAKVDTDSIPGYFTLRG